MDRREFIKYCASTAAAVAAVEAVAAGDAKPRHYARALLVDLDGTPLKAASIPADLALIFHYPFAATPCFLLNLGRPLRAAANLRTETAEQYRWEGGVGPQQSIVAYSAICSHRLTYPTREISFIGYRDKATPHSKRAQVIHCCSEHSQYDPAAGAKVIAGPAPQPLAAILLEHDRGADTLTAVGTLGGEVFAEFFSKYEFRLALEHGGKARERADTRVVVRALTEYCQQQVKC